MLKLILPSFSIFPSVTPIYHIWMFLSEFSQQLLDLGLCISRYEVYRGVYSFCLFCNYVCLSVCLLVCLSVCKLFFYVKHFSATTWVRILKFGVKLDSDKLYCVTKNSHILLISLFICSFFFLSNGNFCHRFLSSYWSQCFKILCTLSGRQSVLC